jgi:hypothetical protein
MGRISNDDNKIGSEKKIEKIKKRLKRGNEVILLHFI